MGRIYFQGRYQAVETESGQKINTLYSLPNDDFNSFSPAVLGLGDISLPAEQVQAVSAIFDLSGFTTFASQVDPHLAVPEYLSRFLDWLFDQIKLGTLKEQTEDTAILWAGLPFLAKFLGDGILFLWDTGQMSGAEMCNIVTSLWEICANYKFDFYPEIKKIVVKPPEKLRCGISRGTVISVGNGEDYVGPCINIAARLQKISQLSFCVSRRGFDFNKDMPEETSSRYLLKSIPLRGIGEEELVWIRKEEFESLPEPEKAMFASP